MTDDTIPAPSGPVYTPDEVILYGIELTNAKGDAAKLDAGLGKGTELQLKLASTAGVSGSIVLAYGYAFEGHCYRSDSTRMFVVAEAPPAEDAKGCGFEAPYKMWRITAVTQLVEISTASGDARALILDAQLPGKRSPASYAITLKIAHRNGRLSND